MKLPAVCLLCLNQSDTPKRLFYTPFSPPLSFPTCPRAPVLYLKPLDSPWGKLGRSSHQLKLHHCPCPMSHVGWQGSLREQLNLTFAFAMITTTKVLPCRRVLLSGPLFSPISPQVRWQQHLSLIRVKMGFGQPVFQSLNRGPCPKGSMQLISKIKKIKSWYFRYLKTIFWLGDPSDHDGWVYILLQTISWWISEASDVPLLPGRASLMSSFSILTHWQRWILMKCTESGTSARCSYVVSRQHIKLLVQEQSRSIWGSVPPMLSACTFLFWDVGSGVPWTLRGKKST